MLVIKKSQLPNAGKGLFTKAPIKKDKWIVEYLGDIYTWKECEERAKEDKEGYVLFVNSKYCIDAFETPQHLARYANDAAGISKVKGLKNNAVYDIEKKRGYIKATRNIAAGEEIFVSYGKDYWDAIRDNIKLEKKKKAAKR